MKYLRNVSTLELFADKCTGCGRCVEVCPHEVFEIKDKKTAIIDKDLCMECGACQMNCKYGALKVNAGVGCAAAIINGFITGGEPSCDCSGGSSSNCC
ncbi:MAG: 4Fe-4S binding protein [Deltaproteobacteria bacterium]|nr:4Fe-4S binding protein [Deltaproteobacteria bacterium]